MKATTKTKTTKTKTPSVDLYEILESIETSIGYIAEGEQELRESIAEIAIVMDETEKSIIQWKIAALVFGAITLINTAFLFFK